MVNPSRAGMARLLSALTAGILFGLGLTVSGMVNPAKVVAFLDLAGNWDPTLAVVMIGALAVAAAFRCLEAHARSRGTGLRGVGGGSQQLRSVGYEL